MTPCIFDGTGFPINPASNICEVMLGEHITARYLQLIVQVFTPIDFLGMRAGVFGRQTADLNRNKSKNDNRNKSTNKAKINRGKRVREKFGTGAYGNIGTSRTGRKYEKQSGTSRIGKKIAVEEKLDPVRLKSSFSISNRMKSFREKYFG